MGEKHHSYDAITNNLMHLILIQSLMWVIQQYLAEFYVQIKIVQKISLFILAGANTARIEEKRTLP